MSSLALGKQLINLTLAGSQLLLVDLSTLQPRRKASFVTRSAGRIMPYCAVRPKDWPSKSSSMGRLDKTWNESYRNERMTAPPRPWSQALSSCIGPSPSVRRKCRTSAGVAVPTAGRPAHACAEPVLWKIYRPQQWVAAHVHFASRTAEWFVQS